VYVNQVPSEGVDPDFVLGYSDSRGTALAENALGLNAKGIGYLAGETGSLGAGTQTLRFVATDSEGNTSTLVKTVLTPENFILVAGGTLPSSSPLGAVAVQTFYIGKYEVQWGEFQAVRTWAAANGYDIGSAGAGAGTNFPVTDVNWYTALKWCNARSEMEGRTPVYRASGAIYRIGDAVPDVDAAANGYRLPSEKEWEWAARGGIQTRSYLYSGSNNINDVGWCFSNSFLVLQVVGTRAPNEIGVYDMSGNVWEFCFEAYEVMEGFRSMRGGCVFGPREECAVGVRGYVLPADSITGHGFRLALNAAP
jgi:formylglycine-generating enzyme required for sulfatase activity